MIESVVQLGEDVIELEVLLAFGCEMVRPSEHAIDAAEVAGLVGDRADAQAPAQPPGRNGAVDIAPGHGMGLCPDMANALTARPRHAGCAYLKASLGSVCVLMGSLRQGTSGKFLRKRAIVWYASGTRTRLKAVDIGLIGPYPVLL